MHEVMVMITFDFTLCEGVPFLIASKGPCGLRQHISPTHAPSYKKSTSYQTDSTQNDFHSNWKVHG